MKAIEQHGLRVPNDVSIVSFDNSVFLDYLNPSITRVCQPIEDIGVTAVKIMMDFILGLSSNQPSILLSPTLEVRDSVRMNTLQL